MIRTEGGHFWITFDNDYTLSCFNGFGSHTENHHDIEKWKKVYMSKKPNPYDNHWESNLVEIVEIPEHRWFVGTQFHPEYSGTVLHPHPLFMSFIKEISKE